MTVEARPSILVRGRGALADRDRHRQKGQVVWPPCDAGIRHHGLPLSFDNDPDQLVDVRIIDQTLQGVDIRNGNPIV